MDTAPSARTRTPSTRATSRGNGVVAMLRPVSPRAARPGAGRSVPERAVSRLVATATYLRVEDAPVLPSGRRACNRSGSWNLTPRFPTWVDRTHQADRSSVRHGETLKAQELQHAHCPVGARNANRSSAQNTPPGAPERASPNHGIRVSHNAGSRTVAPSQLCAPVTYSRQLPECVLGQSLERLASGHSRPPRTTTAAPCSPGWVDPSSIRIESQAERIR